VCRAQACLASLHRGEATKVAITTPRVLLAVMLVVIILAFAIFATPVVDVNQSVSSGSISSSKSLSSSGNISSPETTSSSSDTSVSPSGTPGETTGKITLSPNIGLYSDIGCTNSLNSLSWGYLLPGGSSTQNVYIKNTGNEALTLNLTISEWSPQEAGTFLTVTWNATETQLLPGQLTAALLTLTVSPMTSGIIIFSNDITITGNS